MGRAALLFLCFVDIKSPTFELMAVELLDSLCDSLLLGEFNKGKSSWMTGIAVIRQEYLYHLPHFRKKTFKLALRRIVAHVTNENLVANNNLLSVNISPLDLLRSPVRKEAGDYPGPFLDLP